jgi:hypothetical protein
MFKPTELTEMLTTRAADPHRAVIEATLLRTAFDRLDDHLLWLEEHTLEEHPGETGTAVAELCAQTRRMIADRLRYVDRALSNVDAS